jgi:beta-mannosidase
MKKDKYNSFRELEGSEIFEKENSEKPIRNVIDFSSRHWFMERMNVGEGIKEKIHLLQSELSGNNYSWIPAKVPGDVYTDLYLAGEIDDPFYDRNMGRCKWVQHYEWWYNYSFNVPLSQKGKLSTLYFGGVDYSCDVYLNGEYLGHHEGMLSSFSFDVTTKLIYKNSHTPDNLLTVKLDPPPKNQKNFAGMKHNFAGDYLTGLIPFGIWKPVKLIMTDSIRLTDTRVETKVIQVKKQDRAEVNVSISGSIEGNSPKQLKAKICLSNASESYIEYCDIVDNKYLVDLSIDDALLWYPYELGNPNLYNMEITVFDGDNKLDSIVKRVGLREIKRAMNPGFTSDEAEKKWTFIINEKSMFLRSACWGGQPSFFYGRNNTEKYRFFLEEAKKANINNLRIFGWHPPEVDDFYDICDELGITTWTNFPFATQVFSEEKSYLEKVYKECAEIVKDRRLAACNIMWMGGEEVFFSEAHVESGNKALMIKIGEITRTLTNTPYEDASPLSSREGIKLGYKSKESVHANSHYYAAGAIFMEDYYPLLDACIIPELTAASSPSVESLKKFIKPDDLWPAGYGWGYHAGNMDLLETLNYEVFGDCYNDSLEHFVKATQIAQGTIFQFSLEHFRRCKPHVSGVALCHFMTNWPIVKWDIVDYYGKEKLSYDFVKRCYNPLLPSIKFDKRRYNVGDLFEAEMYVVNDFYEKYSDVDYSIRIYNIKEEIENSELSKEYRLDAGSTYPTATKILVFEKNIKCDIEMNSSKKFDSIEWKVEGSDGESFLIETDLKDKNGKLLSNNAYTILIDDQEYAKKIAFDMYNFGRDERNKYGRAYYRFQPDKIKEFEI